MIKNNIMADATVFYLVKYWQHCVLAYYKKIIILKERFRLLGIFSKQYFIIMFAKIYYYCYYYYY